jgi:hypothetical protein
VGIFLPSTFSVDVTKGVVEAEALVVTAQGHQWLDDRYGPGGVIATSMLESIATPGTE